jgi:hypothetical protein
MKKTKFLFDNPVTRDWLFWLFVAFASLNGIGSIQRVNQSGGVNTSTLSLVSGSIDALFGVFSSYILIVPIYFVRKYIRKRKNLENPSSEEQSSMNVEATEALPDTKTTKSKRMPALIIGALVLVVAIVRFSSGNSASEGDKYFEIEQSISAVVKDWNLAATPVSQAVRGISDGTMGSQDALIIVTRASSQFAVISNRLDDACGTIPTYDVNASGQEGAFAKSYDALQVTCDLLPQESTELLLLVNEQISPVGTQAKIDYHANQISLIVQKRKKAILDSFDAMMPYLSDAQKANIDRMRSVLSN